MNSTLTMPLFKGRLVFDTLTKILNSVLVSYTYTELTMPDGELQRWWRGNDENIVIKYQEMP